MPDHAAALPPGKRATVLVTHGAAPAVAKAYHNPAKAAAVVEEAPDLHAATNGGGLLAFAPTLAFVPDLALVVQQVVHGVPLDSLLGGPAGPGTEPPRRSCTLPGRWPSSTTRR